MGVAYSRVMLQRKEIVEDGRYGSIWLNFSHYSTSYGARKRNGLDL